MSKSRSSLIALSVTILTVLTLLLLPYTPKTAVRTVSIKDGVLYRSFQIEGIVAYRDEQPCITHSGGLVKGVYVKQGEYVRKGQLLFAMDTRTEEAALEYITTLKYQKEQALQALTKNISEGTGEKFNELGETNALTALAQNTVEIEQTESQLLTAIQLKQIRAPVDSTVSGVYVSEGDSIADMGLLGALRGEGRDIIAYCSVNGIGELTPNQPARILDLSGQEIGIAALSETGTPSIDQHTQQLSRRLVFQPMDDPDSIVVGQSVTLEVLRDTVVGMALAPLSAIDSEGCLWIVQDGTATPHKIDIDKRNAYYVGVPLSLSGQRVILSPEEYALSAGCAVKEAKKR